MQAIFKAIGILLLLLGPISESQSDYTDGNILLPISDIEQKLKYGLFEVYEIASFKHLQLQAKFAKVQLPKRVGLRFRDGTEMQVKWKTAERGGQAFNNQPRYELAAYEFQKFLFSESEFVVPPSAIRSMHAAQYRFVDKDFKRTFEDRDQVFFVLQYWLSNVTSDSIYNENRLQTDSTYARHLANMNLFCYLIRHGDSNKGKVIRSTLPNNPRLFAVDNGIAFTGAASDRGTEWRYLRVKNLPRSTVERLRQLTPEQVREQLGTVAEFHFDNDRFVPVEPTTNLDPDEGVRYRKTVVQFGLTSKEIDGLLSRINEILRRIDRGDLSTF